MRSVRHPIRTAKMACPHLRSLGERASDERYISVLREGKAHLKSSVFNRRRHQKIDLGVSRAIAGLYVAITA